MQLIYICLGAFITSWLLTYAVRSYAMHKSLLDIPNERSSHTIPTPRGGGIAIATSFLLGTFYLCWHKMLASDFALALIVGGALIASIGYLDDRYSIGAQWRLLVHFLAAFAALYFLGGFMSLSLGSWNIALGWSGNVLAALLIVWLVNLYNFMDGIDALAGMEGLFVCAAASAMLICLHNWTMVSICLLLMAAIAGFQIWNWPPARIFMGDVSSGLIGYIFAVFIIYSVKNNYLPLVFWIILLAVFITDATCTLFYRIYKREKWYAAHRSHAYQRLVQRGYSHLQVTLGISVVNTLFLLPLAVLTLYYPRYSLLLTLSILLILGICWWKIINVMDKG